MQHFEMLSFFSGIPGPYSFPLLINVIIKSFHLRSVKNIADMTDFGVKTAWNLLIRASKRHKTFFFVIFEPLPLTFPFARAIAYWAGISYKIKIETRTTLRRSNELSCEVTWQWPFGARSKCPRTKKNRMKKPLHILDKVTPIENDWN